jgi:hypothetical protein
MMSFVRFLKVVGSNLVKGFLLSSYEILLSFIVIWERKKFRLSRGVTGFCGTKCVSTLPLSTLHHLGWRNAPYSQNFEISGENSGIKKKFKKNCN